MRNVVVWLAGMLMMLGGVRGVGAQGPRDEDLDLVAKYVDQTAIGVVRINIAGLDTDAVVNDLAHTYSDMLRQSDPSQLGAADEQLKRARGAAKEWRAKFAAAGGRDMYLVIVLNPAASPQVIGILPTGPGAKKDELMALLPDLHTPFTSGARGVDGAILTGPETLTTGMPLAEATRRDEIARELKRAGEAPVQAALIPADFVRRSIGENVTELPKELGGGPATVLTKGVVSGAASLRVAPNWSIKVRLQSESEEAARALAENLKHGFEHLAGRIGPAVWPELEKTLVPRVEGSVVAIDVGADKFETLKKMVMMPALMKARLAARRAVTGSRMRQLGVGCMVYASDNKDQWPPDLQTLVKQGILTEEMLASADHPERRPAYRYIRPDPGALVDADWSQQMVIYETFETWPDGGVWAVFADGHVQVVTDEAKFKEFEAGAKKRMAKP